MASGDIAVIGATSMVGHYAMSILKDAGYSITAFSRATKHPVIDTHGVKWFGLSRNTVFDQNLSKLEDWLCFCPIIALPDYFEMLERAGARRIIALSSTSRFTKEAGAAGLNSEEINLAKQLKESEQKFEAWAISQGIDWVILRPTLIYDLVHDKNLRFIKNFIQFAGFFPLLGEARGLRQPVYAGDVAKACIGVLNSKGAYNTDYNIAGKDALPYRDMVARIFEWLGQKPRFYKVPFRAFKLALFFACWIPRYRNLSITMVERMEFDMVFDYTKATQAFGYAPQFFLDTTLLPSTRHAKR